MDNMTSICPNGAQSMNGKRQRFLFRLNGDRSLFTIHCALYRENLVASNIGNRDLVTILQTVVPSVIKIRT